VNCGRASKQMALSSRSGDAVSASRLQALAPHS
jgi:hypothetical protein